MNFRHLSRSTLISYWGPAIFMLACIGLESTDLMSASKTGGMLFVLLKRFFPLHSPTELWEVNLIIRKCGHVIGYGLLCAAFYRGFRGTLQLSTVISSWKRTFALYSIGATFLVASADEVHQMFIPSRTGTWWDVLLDTSAATVAQVLLYLYFRYRDRSINPPATPTAAEANS